MYAKEGVTSTKEMKRLLKIGVKTELFKDNLRKPTKKRFYPRNSTIRNHMAKVRRKLCHSLMDRDQLQFKVDQWIKEHPSTKIYFRPKGITSVDGSYENAPHDSLDDYDEVKLQDTKEISLLFVYQNAWQKRLFRRYGNEIVLLDATYRTTHCALYFSL